LQLFRALQQGRNETGFTLSALFQRQGEKVLSFISAAAADLDGRDDLKDI
jgi:hypothetical protein